MRAFACLPAGCGRRQGPAQPASLHAFLLPSGLTAAPAPLPYSPAVRRRVCAVVVHPGGRRPPALCACQVRSPAGGGAVARPPHRPPAGRPVGHPAHPARPHHPPHQRLAGGLAGRGERAPRLSAAAAAAARGGCRARCRGARWGKRLQLCRLCRAVIVAALLIPTKPSQHTDPQTSAQFCRLPGHP